MRSLVHLCAALLALTVGAGSGQAEAGKLLWPVEYADSWRGWPLQPVDRPHSVYGTFLNPVGRAPGRGLLDQARSQGFHTGIDLPVDDRRPHPDAPSGTAHPVFALEGGVVLDSYSPSGEKLPAAGCLSSWRMRIGHFGYGHVRPASIPVQQGSPAPSRPCSRETVSRPAS
jgi:hypothetical protein